jgi:hypothetical protein
MRKACSVTLCVAILLGAVASSTASASSSLPKGQYIKQGDAICATAIAKFKALGRASTMAAVAAKGPKWLAIDHVTLKSLSALRPAPANAAAVKTLLAGAQAAINGAAAAVKAAQSGSTSAFYAAGQKSRKLTAHWQAEASSYGFSACNHWGD